MSEAIGEICEWAPNISGKTISINVKSSAVDPRFHGIIFTEDCSAGSPKYGLIRILQQLQSMFQFTPSSQHTSTPEAQSSREWQLAVPYHDGSRHTSVAISPILLNPRTSGSTSNLSPIPASFGSTILHPYRHAKELTREVIACSPLLCQPANYTGHRRSPDLLATSPALPLDTSVVSTSPSGSLSRIEKQVIQLDHMTNKTATPGTPVRDVDLDRQSLGLTPAQHQLDAGVESAYHASPEKQREATRDETVVLPLPVIQPMVKELLESPSSPATELSFHKQQPTPKSSTPSGEIADSPSASHVSDTEHPWTSLQLPEVCVVLTPITRPQGISPVTEAVSVRHPSTRWKDLGAGEHKDMEAFVPPTKEVLVSVGEAPASTPPVDATQLSSSSDATPIALGILKAMNSTLLPGVHYSEASTKTTRKLCDFSTSYLIDTSPANADFPFTPDKPSIFALPELSAEVHFPKRARPNTSAAKRPLNRKSSTGFREESAVESGAHKGKVIERSQPRTSTFHVIRTSITEAADEPITEETVLDLRKQALTETSPTPIGIPPLPSVDTEELAAFPTSRDRTSSFERNANIDIPKPGFSLPKRRFFKSYRSERIARENERFEAARMIKITKRPDSKKRTTGGGQEALRISKPRAARGRLNKRAPPPIAAALADAMIPPTPSRDSSDPDLLIEIVDSQDPQNAHVQNVVVPAAHPILETLIESSQCDDIIPASWNSSADNQIKSKDVTNQLQEEFNWPDDEVLVSSRPPSTPASLFAPTPSPAPARLRRNRKPPTKRPAKKAPLEFHTNQPSFHESQQPLQEPLGAVELEHIDPTDINFPTPGFATVLRRSSLVCEHVHQSLVVVSVQLSLAQKEIALLKTAVKGLQEFYFASEVSAQ
ncbi:unnamed protein product [Dicrocoelium dendriticum]|nr:unnamed protein product [Dicrocoelium dendriticum]